MTRFAWLQTRTQTTAGAILLAALAIAAAITGVQLSHLYNDLVAHCESGCDLAINQFLSHDSFMDHLLDILARVAPALLGMFWGAPLLAREFETGTYRLAWTQSVPRSRWLFTKLALGGLLTATLAGLLTLTITWWYRAYDKVGTNQFDVFDRRDIVPVAYALFAFTSGVLLGAIIRRTVPAMAATLGVFVLARVATSIWVRPRLLPPVNKILTAGPSGDVGLGIGINGKGAPLQLFVKGGGPPGSWMLSHQLVNHAGQKVGSAQIAAFLQSHCANVLTAPAAASPADPGRVCLQQVADTFRVSVTYQPANRYWTFQWLESGIFVLLAVGAVFGCYAWLRRRAT